MKNRTPFKTKVVTPVGGIDAYIEAISLRVPERICYESMDLDKSDFMLLKKLWNPLLGYHPDYWPEEDDSITSFNPLMALYKSLGEKVPHSIIHKPKINRDSPSFKEWRSTICKLIKNSKTGNINGLCRATCKSYRTMQLIINGDIFVSQRTRESMYTHFGVSNEEIRRLNMLYKDAIIDQ